MKPDQQVISFYLDDKYYAMESYFPEQLVKAYKAIGVEAVVTPF